MTAPWAGEYRRHGNDTAFRRARFARRSRRRITVAQRRHNADEVCWQVNERRQAPNERSRPRHLKIGRQDVALFDGLCDYTQTLRSKRSHLCSARASRPLPPVSGFVEVGASGSARDDGPAVKLVGNCRKPASHPVATAWARAINSERLERMESASAAVTSAPDRLPRLSNEMRIPKLPQAHSPS